MSYWRGGLVHVDYVVFIRIHVIFCFTYKVVIQSDVTCMRPSFAFTLCECEYSEMVGLVNALHIFVIMPCHMPQQLE